MNMIIHMGPCQSFSNELKKNVSQLTQMIGINELWYYRIIPDGSKIIRN